MNKPIGIDTWRNILINVIDDVQSCMLEGDGSGGMHYVKGVYATAPPFYL